LITIEEFHFNLMKFTFFQLGIKSNFLELDELSAFLDGSKWGFHTFRSWHGWVNQNPAKKNLAQGPFVAL
jgi:hypothetical protein